MVSDTVCITSLKQGMQKVLCMEVPWAFWNLNLFCMASFLTGL